MYRVIYDTDHPQLQDCPIGCIRSEETIVINPILYNRLSDFEKKFWFNHEIGHIELDTDDEVEADAYAFDQIVNTEYMSMKKMLAALDNLLVGGNPEYDKRKKALYYRAVRWDKAH